VEDYTETMNIEKDTWKKKIHSDTWEINITFSSVQIVAVAYK
jgi:hypothetical protein